MYVVSTFVAFTIECFITLFFAMDSKCALYISNCIWLVHKPSTKCHLGWANERGSTLKAKPKYKIGLF
jgi:hypothetical protein